PVFRAEREDGQDVDPEVAGRAHGAAQRLDAAPVPLGARQAARRGPTAVAVHDDGNMPRYGEFADLNTGQRFGIGHAAPPHTVRISFSFAASMRSRSAITSSVSFCT